MMGTGGGALGEIVVRRMPGEASRALLTVGNLTLPAAIGRSGISAFKREGDGATPLSSMALIEGFYRADRRGRPATRLPMRPLRADDGWCDAPFHACYNRPVTLPFSASHEAMWRKDGLYDIVLVMDWNVRSRRMGAGSAIFLHLIRPGYLPTEGCIALAPRDMERLLHVVAGGTRMTIKAG